MRARVILYNSENDAILLIHRLKNGRNYWVIPGGGAKGNERSEERRVGKECRSRWSRYN